MASKASHTNVRLFASASFCSHGYNIFYPGTGCKEESEIPYLAYHTGPVKCGQVGVAAGIVADWRVWRRHAEPGLGPRMGAVH